MSMSTHIIGFILPDEKWQKMRGVWEACTRAGIDPPEEVEDFFDGKEPDPAGVEIELPVREYRTSDSSGYDLDVSAIPPNVQIIRFYNAW